MSVSGTLVVMQVALSVVLLVAAGLFVGTFRRLASVPLGFDSGRVLVVDVDTARAYADHATRLDYYQRLAEAMAAVPGVAGAAASAMTPFGDGTRSPLFEQPDRIHEHAVTPGYFGTYGMRLSAGRDFRPGDSAQSGRVVIVSEIGIRLALGAAPLQVAGLVLSRLVALLVLGLAAGAVMSLWASRFVATLLYGIDPGDLALLATATAALALASLLAASPAALRAAFTDPAAVLRRG
jgi:hypothetical protein